MKEWLFTFVVSVFVVLFFVLDVLLRLLGFGLGGCSVSAANRINCTF